MKRSAFLRKPTDAATLTVKVPRQRKCSVKGCGNRFIAWQSFVSWCSPECGAVIALAKVAKKEAAEAAAKRKAARTERVETKAKLDQYKRKAEWAAELQKVFNKFIRERDRDQPCICCNRTNIKDYLTGSAWDAGHYRSVGSAPHLRFDERNVHRQLVYCNKDRSGNAVEYRRGLIARLGIEAVEALEADKTPKHYTIDQLKAMKTEYAAKLKALVAQRIAQESA